jgi:hypothetical protein
MEGRMTRLLLAIMATSFICASVPAYAETRDECIKNCQARCSGVPTAGRCVNQCTTMRCKG